MSKHSSYKGLYANQHDYSQDVRSFGEKVRQYREAQGLSLDTLGDLIDSDKGAVSKIENGGRIPKYDTVLKLADALLVTPGMLSPDRFYKTEHADAMTQIYKRLLKLPENQRCVAVSYMCAMLDGLLIQNKGK